MKGNFSACLDIILQHEGGFVNHPKDPGGMTNLGITKRTYEEWKGNNYTATEAEMKALTKADVQPIYEKNYWDRVKGDELPKGIDLCVFDFGVNAGTSRAAKYLQTMIGSPADGAIGPNTLKKLKEYITSSKIEDVIKTYQDDRQKYYESLSNFATFGKGWTRRVQETTAAALKMAWKCTKKLKSVKGIDDYWYSEMPARENGHC